MRNIQNINDKEKTKVYLEIEEDENDLIYLDFERMIKSLIKGIPVILLCTMICGGLMFGFLKSKDRTVYTSSGAIMVNPITNDTNTGTFDVEEGVYDFDSKKTSISVTSINNIGSMMQPDEVYMAMEQDLDMPLSEIKSSVTISSTKDSPFIELSVESDTPEKAKELADAGIDALVNQIGSYETLSVDIVRKPQRNDTPKLNPKKKKVLLAAAAGFILSCACIVLKVLLTPRITSKAMAEEVFGIPVFCQIPDLDKLKG